MRVAPYICLGDPDADFSLELIKRVAPHSDMIELGIPFSDPIADGPTIQGAANRSLTNGFTVSDAFSIVKDARNSGVSNKLVFMTYFNIIYTYGIGKFLDSMNKYGISGLIVPDLPFEEDRDFESLAQEKGISVVNLIAPNTPLERAREILNDESLFTYLVPLSGVTGARKNAAGLDFISRIRKVAGPEKNLFAGFGISGKEQADAYIKAGADGVVIGSRIVDIYTKALEKSQDKAFDAVEEFMMSL
jgi:tryptophan synthase alpha chain